MDIDGLLDQAARMNDDKLILAIIGLIRLMRAKDTAERAARAAERSGGAG